MSTDPHILVVDDNQAAADGLVRLLKALGTKASAVYGAYEALVFVKKEPVTLAFVDIGMPDMDGHQLMRTLRDEGFVAPTLALTGYGHEEDRQRAIEAGFTGHLTKPIGAKELREILSTHVAMA